MTTKSSMSAFIHPPAMSPTSTSRSSYASSLDDGDDEGMIRNRWRRGLSHFVKPALWSPVGAGAAPQIAVSLFLDQEVHGTQGRLALQGCHARCFDRVVDIQDFHLDELLCHGVLHPPSVLLDSRYGGHLCLDQTNRRMEGLRGDRKLRHLSRWAVQLAAVGTVNCTLESARVPQFVVRSLGLRRAVLVSSTSSTHACASLVGSTRSSGWMSVASLSVWPSASSGLPCPSYASWYALLVLLMAPISSRGLFAVPSASSA